MRIALVSPLYESVPPSMYGGTERVIAALADDLVRRGHDVTLFAPGGSQTAAKLVPGCNEPLRMTMTRTELEQVAPHLHLRMLNEVYLICNSIDEMVEAVQTCKSLDRTAVRQGAERFSAAAMTEGYLEVYQQLIGSSQRQPAMS